jgi:hypothetical protein
VTQHDLVKFQRKISVYLNHHKVCSNA